MLSLSEEKLDCGSKVGEIDDDFFGFEKERFDLEEVMNLFKMQLGFEPSDDANEEEKKKRLELEAKVDELAGKSGEIIIETNNNNEASFMLHGHKCIASLEVNSEKYHSPYDCSFSFGFENLPGFVSMSYELIPLLEKGEEYKKEIPVLKSIPYLYYKDEKWSFGSVDLNRWIHDDDNKKVNRFKLKYSIHEVVSNIKKKTPSFLKKVRELLVKMKDYEKKDEPVIEKKKFTLRKKNAIKEKWFSSKMF